MLYGNIMRPNARWIYQKSLKIRLLVISACLIKIKPAGAVIEVTCIHQSTCMLNNYIINAPGNTWINKTWRECDVTHSYDEIDDKWVPHGSTVNCPSISSGEGLYADFEISGLYFVISPDRHNRLTFTCWLSIKLSYSIFIFSPVWDRPGTTAL